MTKQRQQRSQTTTCTCHGLTDPRIANASNAPHHPRCATVATDEGEHAEASTPAAYGPYIYSDKSKRYHAANGQFASLATVTAWVARQYLRYGVHPLRKSPAFAAPVAPLTPHGLYEAHVATSDDAPVRTTPTPAEQRHAANVRLWNCPRTWDSEEEGQAQRDYTTATLA